jgi:CHAD domain-containing protein
MKKETVKGLLRDEGARVYGAGILVKHVQALKEEITGIESEAQDIEFIHRARVASRRLRAALPLFESCLPKKKSTEWFAQIRGVTKSLGAARDTDVQIERVHKALEKTGDKKNIPGLLRLNLRLQQQRQKLQPAVLSAVKSIRDAGTLDQMETRLTQVTALAETVYIYTPVLYQHSHQSITARLDEFLAFEQYMNQPEKVTELHEMRIAAKWLRYTLESFSSLYSSELRISLQTVRKVQEMLGDIHDCDVWKAFIPRFIEKEHQRTLNYFGHARSFHRLVPGIACFQQDRETERDQMYEKFCTSWLEWRDEKVWEELRQAIQVPFPQPGDIYPLAPNRAAQEG